jgi:hypothetical protein
VKKGGVEANESKYRRMQTKKNANKEVGRSDQYLVGWKKEESASTRTFILHFFTKFLRSCVSCVKSFALHNVIQEEMVWRWWREN